MHARADVKGMPASEAASLGDRNNEKAPGDAGALTSESSVSDQYFATTGPVQLKR